MFNNLTALALGIVIFAVTIGVGLVLLAKFGTAVASCGTGYTYSTATGTCCLDGGADCVSAGNYTAASTGTQNVNSLMTELGTSGLAGWTAAIIALAVGILFIASLMGKKKY